MAITILSKPNENHSGYNPVKYKVNSTNNNKPAFRYIVDVIDSITLDKVAEFFVAPDPLDSNYGNIDISRILQNKLDGFFTTTQFDSRKAIGASYNYKVEFGESYSKDWAFNSYMFLPNGQLGFTTSTSVDPSYSNVTHNYVVGDQIRVTLNSTYSDNRDLLNTYFEVVEVVNTRTIRVNLGFNVIGSFPATPGKSVYANNEKFIERDLAEFSATAVNTAMNLEEYVSTQGSLIKYELGSLTSNILTNQPKVYTITPEQFVFFNTLDGGVGSAVFTNDSGDVALKSIVATGFGSVNSIGVGASNIGTLSVTIGTLPIVKPDTKWYEVIMVSSSGAKISETFKFVIDRRCQINDTQIMFMDRKGSYNSFAFQLKHRENISTSKEQFDKYSDITTTTSKGSTVYYSEAERTLSLATNFMGEASNMYYQELMTSRNTYILWQGVWYACVIQDTSFQNEYERNNKLIKKTATVKFAINDPIN
jgi:hypothetical protein